MIKNMIIITLVTTTSLHAMDIPSDDITRYIKTSSISNLTKKKHSIKKLKHKRDHLKEKLAEKPNVFWMWTPEECTPHDIYTAKNRDDLTQIINWCNPSVRMGDYSVIGILMLSQLSLQEKKEIISTLLSKNYIPTTADKKLNLLGTWERCEEKKIIKNIYLFKSIYTHNIFLQQLPQDIIHIIMQLMFNTESLL
jgi:hypothetical protein